MDGRVEAKNEAHMWYSLGEQAFHEMFRLQATKEHSEKAFVEVKDYNVFLLEIIGNLHKEASDLQKGMKELR